MEEMPDPLPGRPTVVGLADAVQPRVLTLIATGAHGDRPVDGVRIADAAGHCPSTPQRDVIALVPLPVALRDEVVELSERESARGCVGVVIDADADGVPTVLVESLVRRGLTVYQRHPGTTWLQVADAIRDAMRMRDHVDGELIGTIARGDLKSFAEALSEMLGGPVTVEDIDFRVLAFSTTDTTVDPGRDSAILGGRMPEIWRAHLERTGALETLLTSDQTVVITDGPLNAQRRLLKSIWDGNRPLGILWLAEGSTPLPDDVDERLERAAQVAVPHLLHYQEETYDRRADQRRKLRRLLESDQQLGTELDDLNMRSAHGFALLALCAAPGEKLDHTTTVRLVESVDLYCLSYGWRTATTVVASTVYSLIALDEDRDRTQIIALAQRLADYVRQHRRVDVTVSVAGPLPDAGSIATLRGQCDAVSVLQQRRADLLRRVLHHRDAFHLVLLDSLQATAEGFDPLSYHKLDRIVQHDRRRGTEYLATLAVYLRSAGKVSVTADRMGLHHTTLRYRIRRIEELSQLDLDDPDERLYCQFVLRDLPG
jgi:hypothetical protein